MISRLKKLLSNVGPALTDQVMVSGTNFVVGLSLAKLLGLEIFGQFSLIWLILLLALDLQRAIIIVPAFTFGPKTDLESDYWHDLISADTILTLFLAIIGGAIVCLSGHLFPSWHISGYYIPFAVLVVSRLYHEFYRRLFFVRHTPHKALIIDFISIVGLILGLIGLWWYKELNLQSILWLHAMSYVFSVTVALFMTRHLRIAGFHPLSLLVRHWPVGKWMLGTVLSQYITNNILIFSGAAILGPAAVGVIRIIQYLYGPVHILFMTADNIIPIHSAKELAEKGLAAFRTYMKQSSVFLSGATILYVLAITLLSPFITPFLIDETIDHMIWYVIGYGLSYTLVSVTVSQMFALRTLEFTRPIFVAYCITALVNMLIAYPLVEIYSIFGIIAGLILARIISIAWFGRSLTHKIRELFPTA